MAKRLKQPKTLTPEQVAALAESVGLPGETFAQIARGESGYQVGAVGHDPGGTQGLGLWQITTKYNDDIIKKFGGRQKLLTDPLANARAAKAIYDRQGIKAWYGTKYMTGPDLHYKGTSQPPVSPAPAAAPLIQATAATPGVNNAPLRRQAVMQFLQQGGVRNQNAVLGLAGTYGQLADVPGQAATYTQPQAEAQPSSKKLKGGIVPLGGSKNAGKGTFDIDGPNPGRLQPGLTAFAKKVAAVYGGPLVGKDGSTHSKFTVNGNVSEHYTGNATDIFTIGGKPAQGKTLLRAGRAALIAAGMPRAQALKAGGGLYNVGSHQIIFLTNEGGNHFDHLHISTHAK